MEPISQSSNWFRQFSGLTNALANPLGLNDRNLNGVIDPCKSRGCDCGEENEEEGCEGFNRFVNTYGQGTSFEERLNSIDKGFHANGVTVGARDGIIQEHELWNFLLQIQFIDSEDFADIQKTVKEEINAYASTNNIPWLGERDTAMTAVTRILGEGWNEREVDENEARRMFRQVMQELGIIGRTGLPSRHGGYNTLSEFINRRSGYCFEVAQFGVWFFSELRINSVVVQGALNASTLHDAVRIGELDGLERSQRLNSRQLMDWFGSSNGRNVNWYTMNTPQTLGTFYRIQGNALGDRSMYEQAVLYDKYSLDNVGRLIDSYFNNSFPPEYTNIIDVGEFFLENNNIDQILSARHPTSANVRNQVRGMLIMLLVSYSETNNKSGFDRMAVLLKKHFANDTEVNNYLNIYRL